MKYRKKMVCKDGFNMSVQASEYHYRTPRYSDCPEYTHVEIGYPNQDEELLKEYAEDENKLTSTVYPYVPVEVVKVVVDKHGGLTEYHEADYAAIILNDK